MKNIRSADLHEQIESGHPPVIVDVRSLSEYASGHLPGAFHLPFWKSLFQGVGGTPDKESLLVLYCEHGPRAVLACYFLRARGYVNIALLKGHMNDWRRNGRPVSD